MSLGKDKRNTILIRTEPKSVFPAQYQKKVERLYGLIISPGFLGDNFDKSKFVPQTYYPQRHHGGPGFEDLNSKQLFQKSIDQKRFELSNWHSRAGNIILLASNKFSPLPNSGYDLRRRIAELTIDFDGIKIYGMYWNVSVITRLSLYLSMLKFNLFSGFIPNLDIRQLKKIKSRNIIGEAGDKYTLLQNAKFQLIVENSIETVTEKIFDAFILGIIPIYCGPDLENLGIPSSTYIEINWDLSNLLDVIENLNQINVENYLMEILNFMKSENFWNIWEENASFNRIAQFIRDYIQKI